ncbi:MAG: hypothetical protein V2B14_03550 [bacterium]
MRAFILFLVVLTMLFNYCLFSIKEFKANAFDNYSSSTTIVAMLPSIINIEGVLIDGNEIFKFERTPFLNIKRIIKINNNSNLLELSSFQFKIKHNSLNPISLTADFSSLSSRIYDFPKDSLTITPYKAMVRKDASISSTAYISPEFTPFVKVDNQVPPGMYEGTITLTIAAL